MAGGPTVNLLIAFFIFAGLFATYGNPASRGAAPHGERRGLRRAGRPGRASLYGADPVSPARRPGWRSETGSCPSTARAINDWTDCRASSATTGRRGDHRRRARRPRADAHTDTMVTPRPTEATRPADSGRVPRRLAGGDLHDGRPDLHMGQMGRMAKDGAGPATLPVKVWGVAQAIAGVKPRAVDSPVSVVGGGRLAGETASAQDFPVKDKLVCLLGLVAGFNFFIGLFNFVPLLPLDGGHIAGALWEAVRRSVARLRRRPDPGYVDVARLLPVAYVVASFLLVMGVVLIVGDLVVPVQVSDLSDSGEPRSVRWGHDRRQPRHARRSAAGARPPPPHPPDQGGQGRRRQRLTRSRCSRCARRSPPTSTRPSSRSPS